MRALWLGMLVAAGCGTPWVEGQHGEWRTLVATLRSNGSGNINLSVRPQPDETAMLLSLQPLDAQHFSHLRFLQIDGRIPYRATDETSSAYSRSSAAYVSGVTNLNWPIMLSDGALPDGPMKFTAGIVDGSRQYTRGNALVGVMLKPDPDFTSGLLRVDVVFGGDTGGDPDITRAVDEAIQYWRDLYAPIGIQLDLEVFSVPESSLQAPGQGDAAAYVSLARSTRFGAVNVVILEEIAGFNGVLGFAGNIPGPLTSTPQSAVAIDVSQGAGADGVFQPDEVAMLGETMAHEVGHFLGLYHPVEIDGYSSWDALDDTAECSGELECIQQLGDNLMYPIPICDGNACLPQDTLTTEQGAVANRYTGVL